ncbi:MAG: ABC transporter permease [Phycisphaerae bacterium]
MSESASPGGRSAGTSTSIPTTDRSIGPAIWALYELAIRQHIHGRRWIAMLLLALLPTIIALITRGTDPFAAPKAMEFGLIFMLIPQGLLPLLALIYASGVMQDEQEDQTLTYLFIRPIPKWLIYLVKLASAVTAAEMLSVISIALTYAVIFHNVHGPDGNADHIIARCLVACAIHGLAVLAYCGIFGLMGLVTRRVLIVGILYIALFEGLFANIPFNLRIITVIYYARLLIYRLLPFRGRSGYGIHATAARTWNLVIRGDRHLKAYPHNWVCVIVLLSACIITALLAAFICNNREFYVKTPVKTD